MSPFPTPSVVPSLGNYSQAVTVEGPGRWVFLSGQVGVDANGELKQGFEAQAHQVWRNVAGILHDAGMTMTDLVKTTAYVTQADHLPMHRAIRNEHVGEARPAGTLLVVSRLGPPDALIEVEAIAFRAGGRDRRHRVRLGCTSEMQWRETLSTSRMGCFQPSETVA